MVIYDSLHSLSTKQISLKNITGGKPFHFIFRLAHMNPFIEKFKYEGYDWSKLSKTAQILLRYIEDTLEVDTVSLGYKDIQDLFGYKYYTSAYKPLWELEEAGFICLKERGVYYVNPSLVRIDGGAMLKKYSRELMEKNPGLYLRVKSLYQ